jgi:predicted amidohydrolase YtcJ
MQPAVTDRSPGRRPSRLKQLTALSICLLAALASGWVVLNGVTPVGVGANEPAADLLLTGGRVWTGDASAPWAEAVAVRGERIAAVGTTAAVAALRGAATRVVELGGRLVVPGFNDSHIHLLSGALSLERVDLIEDETLEGVQARIRDFAAEHPERAWVLGRGWLYGAFAGGAPTRAQLDAVVSDRPAYMECYDGHSGWANSRALALAGITKDTKDPVNGVIVRDPATGEPTGFLKESATSLVESKVPQPDAEGRYALLVEALRRLSAAGITSVQDAAFSAEDAKLLERAREEGKLSVRIRAALAMDPAQPQLAIAAARDLRARHADAWLSFDAVKGFVDGVVEAKTAAMLAPYPGTEDHGLPNWTAAALNAAAVAADREGLQLWLHAIGDGAVRMALDAHAAAATAGGPRDRRGRIEHIETIHPADYPRFSALGVIASMQPLHADPNSNIFEVWAKNAGPDRATRGFGWRRIEAAPARLAFGSDWPVVTYDVFRGLYCAVTRKTRHGQPPDGWLPELAVPVENALRHYTVDAAYAGFAEQDKGTLAAGQLADLVVLSEDITQGPPEKILEAQALLTVVGGRAVHAATGWEAAAGS